MRACVKWKWSVLPAPPRRNVSTPPTTRSPFFLRDPSPLSIARRALSPPRHPWGVHHPSSLGSCCHDNVPWMVHQLSKGGVGWGEKELGLRGGERPQVGFGDEKTGGTLGDAIAYMHPGFTHNRATSVFRKRRFSAFTARGRLLHSVGAKTAEDTSGMGWKGCNRERIIN